MQRNEPLNLYAELFATDKVQNDYRRVSNPLHDPRIEDLMTALAGVLLDCGASGLQTARTNYARAVLAKFQRAERRYAGELAGPGQST